MEILHPKTTLLGLIIFFMPTSSNSEESKLVKPLATVENVDLKSDKVKTGATISQNELIKPVVGQQATDEEQYKNSVMRKIGKVWQKEVSKYADRITPGQLTLSLNVNHKGEVVGIKELGEGNTQELAKGITIMAIRKTEIPIMPDKLKTNLQEKLVEFIITFNF